jgi:hypothetical protein
MRLSREAAEKASKEIEAVLTEDQRKHIPELRKAMRTLRDAFIPPPAVARIGLTSKQIAQLASGAGQQWGREKVRAILTNDQQAQIDPWLRNGGRPGGPGGPPPFGGPDGGPGFGPPNGPGSRGGQRGPGGPGGPDDQGNPPPPPGGQGDGSDA